MPGGRGAKARAAAHLAQAGAHGDGGGGHAPQRAAARDDGGAVVAVAQQAAERRAQRLRSGRAGRAAVAGLVGAAVQLEGRRLAAAGVGARCWLLRSRRTWDRARHRVRTPSSLGPTPNARPTYRYTAGSTASSARSTIAARLTSTSVHRLAAASVFCHMLNRAASLGLAAACGQPQPRGGPTLAPLGPVSPLPEPPLQVLVDHVESDARRAASGRSAGRCRRVMAGLSCWGPRGGGRRVGGAVRAAGAVVALARALSSRCRPGAGCAAPGNATGAAPCACPLMIGALVYCSNACLDPRQPPPARPTLRTSRRHPAPGTMRRCATALLSAAARPPSAQRAAALPLSGRRRPISSAAGGDAASRDPRQRSVQGGDPDAGTGGAGAAATAAATGRAGGFRGRLPGEPDLRGFPGGRSAAASCSSHAAGLLEQPANPPAPRRRPQPL